MRFAFYIATCLYWLYWGLQGVQYGATLFRSGVFQAREGETWYLAQAVALVFPRYRGIHEIDLLMDESHLHPWESRGNHLEEEVQMFS